MTLKEYFEIIEDLMDVYGEDIEIKCEPVRDVLETPSVDYNDELDCIIVH